MRLTIGHTSSSQVRNTLDKMIWETSDTTTSDPMIRDHVNYRKIGDVCSGRVAVVGNGPLTEKQKATLKNADEFDCVVRFNGMNNADIDDRVDVLATRFTKASYFPMRKDIPNSVNVWPVAPTKTIPDDTIPEQFLSRVDPLMVYEDRFKEITEDSTVFQSCSLCSDSDMCHHSSAKHGPSTGCIVLDALESEPLVEDIFVYGMNWNASHTKHIDFAHPELIATCCTKCNVEATASDAYRD